MSEIGAGRASNGGARTGGPVPVSTGTRTGMKTPTDVMRERNAREARRQEEQRAEEQRRLAEERRRSAERRAAAVSGAAPRFSQSSSQYTPDMQQGQFDNRGSTRVAGSDAYGDPTGRTSQNYDAPRPRALNVPQPEQQRVSQTTPAAGGTRRTQQSQAAPRQPTASSSSAAQQPSFQSDNGQPRQSGASSFPHAFERWETLSSHWEGLTSYWIRRLEQNTEEMKDSVPNAVTLNRQITDLSAAGANLFHAVVELQRLRASSERKFQRWFFETRAETEKNRETSGQVENQLKLERSAREEAARQKVEATIQAENARREVAEMKRELNIAKDEARRAWEELGRRNQESLETAQALKDGRVTVVGGVQVVPYLGGPSRSGTGASQRPVTRDGQPMQYSSTGMASAAGAAGLQSPGDDERYYRQAQQASPTNTDPFMESSGPSQPLHHEPGKTSLAAGSYQPSYGDTPTSAATAQTAIPIMSPLHPSAGSPGQSRTPRASDNIPISAADAQRFYQQPPQQTFLHSPPGSTGQPTSQGLSAPREDIRSEGSYVGTSSENDTEYMLDSHGNIQYDEQGRPLITYRRRGNGNGNGGGGATTSGAQQQQQQQVQHHDISDPDDDEDDYDAEAIQREQELSQRCGGSSGGGGGGMPLAPEAPTVPSTAAQAMATFQPTATSGAGGSSGGGRPDYSGQDYGPWEAVQTRHHHPTRLSDVLEEEEERSSRRTGPE